VDGPHRLLEGQHQGLSSRETKTEPYPSCT
jgi:hypothetical protein